MKFNEKLLKMRKLNNITQEELADMLDVSRQSVSKWESGTTYPEMDKLLSMCKIFKCSLDDLTNDEVTEININNKSKYNVDTIINESLEMINKTYKMIINMGFKSIIKMLLEMVLVILILLIFRIPFDYVLNLGSDIFRNFGSRLGNGLISLWSFVINIIYMSLAIIVFVYIFKMRFLDKYNEEKEEKNVESKEVDDIQVIREEKRVLKINESTNKHDFVLFNILATIILYFVKFVAFCISLFFVISLLFFIVCFVIAIILLFKGVIYIGVILGIIAAIIMNILILESSYNFFFKKSTNHKRVFITFLVSLAILGMSISFSIFEIGSITYNNNPPEKLINVIDKEIAFNNELIVSMYRIDGPFEFIVDEKYKDTMLIEVTYCDDLSNVTIDSKDNILSIMQYYKDANKFRIYMDSIINDLANKEIHNYDILSTHRIKIYTSSSNITILNKNAEEYNKKMTEEGEQQLSKYYQNQINELNNQIMELENANNELENQNSDYKSKIEEYERKIQQYKDSINNLLIE